MTTDANREALQLASLLLQLSAQGRWSDVAGRYSDYPGAADPWLGAVVERLCGLGRLVTSDPAAHLPVIGFSSTDVRTIEDAEVAIAAVIEELDRRLPSRQSQLAQILAPRRESVKEDVETRRWPRVVGVIVVMSALSAVGTWWVRNQGAESAPDRTVPVVPAAPSPTVPPPQMNTTSSIGATSSSSVAGVPTTIPPSTSPPFAVPESAPYFLALSEFGLEAAVRMEANSTPSGPAWSYAHHLVMSFGANPRLADATTSLTQRSATELDFCLGSNCFLIDSVEIDSSGRVVTFSVNGRPLEEMVLAWTDGPGRCWRRSNYANCFDDDTATIQIASIYTVGSTYVTLFVDTGDGLLESVDFVAARLITRSGTEHVGSAFNGAPVAPGFGGAWSLRFAGVLPSDVAQIIVTATWDGGEDEWAIEID